MHYHLAYFLICMVVALAVTTEASSNATSSQKPKTIVSDVRADNLFTSLRYKQRVIDKRFVRRTRGQRRSEACDMLIAIDEPLYVTYRRDLRNLTKMAQLYVKQLNEIYHNTVLMEGYNDIYFRIKEIRILYDFCTQCNQTQQVFLEEFTKMDTSSFCLAHIFTFRDFPAGIQGLAYKGTVCSNSYNTGFTTFLNHQVQSSASDSVMTFAHEVGHNMGAEHDEDAGCSSGYIMSESGSAKLSHKDQEFSSCSIKAIHERIDHVRHFPYRNCFKHHVEKDSDNDFSICGDFKVEGDEECDCGMSYKTCNDPCCYAAHISPEDLSWNQSAIPCRRHTSPICLHPFRSALTFGVIVPWAFIGNAFLILLIGLCYDWKHNKKCFKHYTEHAGTIIETNSNHQQRSKSEPPPGSIHEMKALKKPKAPPPPPPLVAPYLPPMRSHSQPAPIRSDIAVSPITSNGSGPFRPSAAKPISAERLSRPQDPPPPVPSAAAAYFSNSPPPILHPKPQIQLSPPMMMMNNTPPVVPYNTRPDVSSVAYLKKKYEGSTE